MSGTADLKYLVLGAYVRIKRENGWRLISVKQLVKLITARLSAEYGVTKDDVKRILTDLIDEGILEPVI